MKHHAGGHMNVINQRLTPRQAQLFRLYEAALRKPTAREAIRWELRQNGFTLDELHAFQVRVQRMIRAERKKS